MCQDFDCSEIKISTLKNGNVILYFGYFKIGNKNILFTKGIPERLNF